MVGAVDEDDLDVGALQALGGGEPGKASTDNDHSFGHALRVRGTAPPRRRLLGQLGCDLELAGHVVNTRGA